MPGIKLASFFKTSSKPKLTRFLIDEVNCVSQYGHDFRPDYQDRGVLKQKFPKVPVLALTGTATASVKADVVQAVGLVNCIIFRQSLNRQIYGILLCLRPKSVKMTLINLIKKTIFYECGIIYCLSRVDCEKVAEKLHVSLLSQNPDRIPNTLLIALVMFGCDLVFSLIGFAKGGPSSLLAAIAKSGFTAIFN